MARRRARTDRRERERAMQRIVRDKQRLASLEPGGSAERPIEVASSSVIPVRARSLRCPLCDGSLRLDEESAQSASLRAAHMTCASCGVSRKLWFVIRPSLPS
jgi:hypothetical protein